MNGKRTLGGIRPWLARTLGIKGMALYNKIAKYGIKES